MQILSKDIKKLYTTGKSTKYRLQPEVLQNFFEVMAICESSKNIYDLWNEPSLKFEKLKGSKNSYSMRIDRKYRLEVIIEWLDEKKIEGIIKVDEISAHYK